MKKVVSVLLVALLLCGGLVLPVGIDRSFASDTPFYPIDYTKGSAIRVLYEGQPIAYDVNPVITGGRTLVPMRLTFETFGFQVDWNPETRVVTGASPDYTISFTIDSQTAYVNNEPRTLDVPAKILNGRTLIPLRFLSEAMGYRVVWVGASNLILISRSDIVEWRYGGFEATEPYKEYEIKYVNGVSTAETRYTGKLHEVAIVNLYSADGRIVPNVPDFKVAKYGSGWSKTSPFAGKTYWIDIDHLSVASQATLYNPDTLTPLDLNLLKGSAASGNYVKVKIEQHYFDLAQWKQLDAAGNPTLAATTDAKTLNETIIDGKVTLVKATVNDQYTAVGLLAEVLRPVLKPRGTDQYAALTVDPRTKFNWPDSTWNSLKGETPWVGMTKDMLLVQQQRTPDYKSSLKTEQAVLELLVYNKNGVESIYYFRNGVLTGMY